MEPELRKLIITKCRSRGISVAHLSQVAELSITELKGYEQGLLILGDDKLIKLIIILNIDDSELLAAVGEEAAARLIQLRSSTTV